MCYICVCVTCLNVHQSPVMNIDLPVTILDIAGVNLSTVNMDGQSFLPQMVSEREQPMFLINHTVYCFNTVYFSVAFNLFKDIISHTFYFYKCVTFSL